MTFLDFFTMVRATGVGPVGARHAAHLTLMISQS